MSPLIFWQYVGWGVLALIVIGAAILIAMLLKDSKARKNAPISLPSLKPANSKQEEKASAIFNEGDDAINPMSRRARRQRGGDSTPTVDKNNLPARSSAFFDEDDDDDFKLTGGAD